jgi:hypothetical protein
MLPRSDSAARVHPDCPAEIKRAVDVMLATSLAGQRIGLDETLGDVVTRVCPEIHAPVEAAGFELRFDLSENTHFALLKGRINYQIRKKLAS